MVKNLLKMINMIQKRNFDGFRPLLDKIKFIIMQYKEGDKWEKED